MSTTRILAIALVGAAAIACGGNDEPSVESLSGTWSIVKFEYVNPANTSERVDLVALGMTGTVTLNADGQYAVTTTDPGSAPETFTGTWSRSVDTFTLQQSGSSGNSQFDMTLGDNVLTLTGADAEFDFNGDDVPEPAKWNITLERI